MCHLDRKWKDLVDEWVRVNSTSGEVSTSHLIGMLSSVDFIVEGYLLFFCKCTDIQDSQKGSLIVKFMWIYIHDFVGSW